MSWLSLGEERGYGWVVELVDWEGAAWIFRRLLTLQYQGIHARALGYRWSKVQSSGDMEGRVEEDWRANTVSSASQVGGSEH